MTQRVIPREFERWQRRALPGTILGVLILLAPTVRAESRECGTRRHTPTLPFAQLAEGDRTNCSGSLTNPDPIYREGGLYEFVLVVHVIENGDGDGALSEEDVFDQVQVVNEDFRALLGDADGRTDTQVAFRLATVDPTGDPTSGITRSTDDDWFHDRGSYWKQLAWDPNRYVNVYTNDTGDLLGYAFLPADGASDPGDVSDRVVIHWQRFGRGRGEVGNAGRTLTHELGHYLGLDHTFAPNPTEPETFVCPPGDAPDCYASGDLLCDTPSEDSANESCEPRSTCGDADAIENFMNYTPDLCMDRFSAEQTLRMRCTAKAYRPTALWPSGRLLATESPRARGSANFVVALTNESHFAQSFTVDVAASDFEVSLGEASGSEGLSLAPGETAEFPLVVDLALAQAAGTVTLRARSELNLFPAELSVGVDPDPEPLLALSAVTDTLDVSALDETKIALELANLGVTEELVDLTAQGAWVTRTGFDTPLPLAAFERQTVELWLQAPEDASPGDTATLRVAAESTRTPDSVVRRTVSLRAERWVAARLSATETGPRSVRPGAAGRTTFLLSNLGNAEQTYRLGLNADPGISASLDRWDVGPLGPFDAKGPFEIAVDYRVDETAPLDRDARLRLSATAVETDEVAVAETVLVVSEAGRVGVEPDRQILLASFDEPVPFTVTAHNLSDDDDRFRATTRSESRVVSGDVGEELIRAGDRAEFEFVVSPDAVDFERETTWITVASLAHPERTASVELVLVRRVNADGGPGSPEACSEATCDGASCGCRVPRRQAPIAPLWAMLSLCLGVAVRRHARRALRT